MLTGLKLAVPIVGILRGIKPEFFADLMPAAFAMGLEAIEVTMNTDSAEQMVTAQRPFVPEGKYLGMGTIRNLAEAERAVAAGAMFLVTPNLDQQVIDFAKAQGIPVITGALTPTEVYSAWAGGADMVKVFPCTALGGASYIRELRGPFDRIPLVAVGGVTADNLTDYFAAGAAAVGVSSSLFGKQALQARDIDRVADNVREFIARCPVS